MLVYVGFANAGRGDRVRGVINAGRISMCPASGGLRMAAVFECALEWPLVATWEEGDL